MPNRQVGPRGMIWRDCLPIYGSCSAGQSSLYKEDPMAI